MVNKATTNQRVRCALILLASPILCPAFVLWYGLGSAPGIASEIFVDSTRIAVKGRW